MNICGRKWVFLTFNQYFDVKSGFYGLKYILSPNFIISTQDSPKLGWVDGRCEAWLGLAVVRPSPKPVVRWPTETMIWDFRDPMLVSDGNFGSYRVNSAVESENTHNFLIWPQNLWVVPTSTMFFIFSSADTYASGPSPDPILGRSTPDMTSQLETWPSKLVYRVKKGVEFIFRSGFGWKRKEMILGWKNGFLSTKSPFLPTLQPPTHSELDLPPIFFRQNDLQEVYKINTQNIKIHYKHARNTHKKSSVHNARFSAIFRSACFFSSPSFLAVCFFFYRLLTKRPKI